MVGQGGGPALAVQGRSRQGFGDRAAQAADHAVLLHRHKSTCFPNRLDQRIRIDRLEGMYLDDAAADPILFQFR